MSNWQYKIQLEEEKIIGEKSKQRIADIFIRKMTDNQSRFSMQIPLKGEEYLQSTPKLIADITDIKYYSEGNSYLTSPSVLHAKNFFTVKSLV